MNLNSSKQLGIKFLIAGRVYEVSDNRKFGSCLLEREKRVLLHFRFFGEKARAAGGDEPACARASTYFLWRDMSNDIKRKPEMNLIAIALLTNFRVGFSI